MRIEDRHETRDANVSDALPLAGATRAAKLGAATSRFRLISWIIVSLLLLLDAIGVLGILVIASKDDLTNVILAIFGLLAVNMALLMPLAQMWLAVELEDRAA